MDPNPPAFWPTPPPYEPVPPQRVQARLSGAAITGIVLASVATLATVIGFGVFVALLVQQAGTFAERSGAGRDHGVDRYTSDETLYSFPAALEYYSDGRYADDCPPDADRGCWEAAVFPERACASMAVFIGYAHSTEVYEPDHVERRDFEDVTAGRPLEVVFADDDYEYGWVWDVTCLDAKS